jgi:hypothetical protein
LGVLMVNGKSREPEDPARITTVVRRVLTSTLEIEPRRSGLRSSMAKSKRQHAVVMMMMYLATPNRPKSHHLPNWPGTSGGFVVDDGMATTTCPVFRPTLEEFSGGFQRYVESIEDKVKPHGRTRARLFPLLNRCRCGDARRQACAR